MSGRGEGVHILWEIIVKGVQYRLAEWHKRRCAKGKHDWREQEESTLETDCKWCPATAWRYQR